MRRWLAVLSLTPVLAAGCGSGDDAAPVATTVPPASTSPASTTPASTGPVSTGPATTGATSPSTRPRAATAVIEPAAVAGIGLGSTKSQAIAVLGTPTTTGQETDLGGTRYDFLRWELAGPRGLTLNFRTTGATSPLLTDWLATAPGPATKRGVQVGDDAAKVTAAHGALEPFCCGATVASVSESGGRMIVVVDSMTRRVVQIIGGDPASWSRSIAD